MDSVMNFCSNFLGGKFKDTKSSDYQNYTIWLNKKHRYNIFS